MKIWQLKKRKDQLESLLDWEREGRLFKNVDLFNQKVSPTLSLREAQEKLWIIEVAQEVDGGHYHRVTIPIKHKTLINLGLTILEAITFSGKRKL